MSYIVKCVLQSVGLCVSWTDTVFYFTLLCSFSMDHYVQGLIHTERDPIEFSMNITGKQLTVKPVLFLTRTQSADALGL